MRNFLTRNTFQLGPKILDQQQNIGDRWKIGLFHCYLHDALLNWTTSFNEANEKGRRSFLQNLKGHILVKKISKLDHTSY